MTKVCSKCGVEKDVEHFRKEVKYKGKQYYGDCLICSRKYQLKRYHEKKDLSKRREYYNKNKKHLTDVYEKWKKDNKNKHLDSQRKFNSSYVDNLQDCYVKQVIRRKFKVNKINIGVVSLQRAILQAKRYMKEVRNEG